MKILSRLARISWPLLQKADAPLYIYSTAFFENKKNKLSGMDFILDPVFNPLQILRHL